MTDSNTNPQTNGSNTMRYRELVDCSLLVGCSACTAKAKTISVFREPERLLSVTTICERAGFGSRHSWYDYKDGLLACLSQRFDDLPGWCQ